MLMIQKIKLYCLSPLYWKYSHPDNCFVVLKRMQMLFDWIILSVQLTLWRPWIQSSLKFYLYKNMCNSEYIIHVKMKVASKIPKTYVFSPKFNIRIIYQAFRSNFAPLLRQNLLSTLFQAMWIMKIFHSIWWEQGRFLAYGSSQYFFLIPSSGSLLGVAHTCVGQHSADTWGASPLGFPFSGLWPELSLHPESSRAHQVYYWPPKGHCSSLSYIQCLQTYFPVYVVLLKVILGRRLNLVPATSFWAEANRK